MSETDVLNQALSDAYDETPYVSNAFSMSAPGRLRAVAALYGLPAPAVESARVLEIGCAAGGNLLPFAAANPVAKVVGIDLSPQQIKKGRAAIEVMDLRNVDLRAMSVTDVTPEFGQFDYIIAHGVFSWVPPEVRAAILRVCRENLAPEGIAYISYNTYPGWKASDVVRDAMILNSHSISDPQERLARAKDVLGMLEHGLSPNNPMRSSLQHAARQLRSQSDYYLMHEHLEAVNSPCYFLEFVAAAQQAGLTYLADAEPQASMASNYGDNVAVMQNALSANETREVREQYLDFAVGRTFRKSMLVHSDRDSKILDRPEANAFAQMYLAAFLTRQPTPAGSPTAERRYLTIHNVGIASQDASFVAVAEVLRQAWPKCVPFSDLVKAARPKTRELPDSELDELVLHHLVTLLNANALEYRLEPVTYESRVPPELIAGLKSLREFINLGNHEIGLYNLWHHNVRLPSDPICKFIMGHIDGTNTVSGLRTLLRDALAAGELAHPSGKSLKRTRNLDSVAQSLLNDVLTGLRNQGVLI
ncbi:hypothetical protein LMG26690_05302 [Achromobacter animicus]|uniref:Uncharacterized protein n=1 Tax=Achromobacter animicus TaxID=1389935 RepID=A0A6S7ALL7_9BURK|nr:class I SAM-dependent methyltransferase [Achromobacter animicus]CAB3736476.1 hypothetical protein LMG26690_05302 [Achromobacter animicus]